MNWRYAPGIGWFRLYGQLRNQPLRYWAADRYLPRFGPDIWLVLISVS